MSIRRYAKDVLQALQGTNSTIFESVRTGLPSDGAFVQFGTGARRIQNMLATLALHPTRPSFAFDEPEQRINDLRRYLAHGSVIARGSPLTAEMPSKIALCVVANEIGRLPDIYEEFLYERLAPRLMDGAVAILPFCRDVSSTGLARAGLLSLPRRNILKEFLRAQFAATKIESPDILREKFATCPVFEFVDWSSPTKRDVSNEPIVWIALRKRSPLNGGSHGGRSGANKSVALPRTRRADQYPIDDFAALVSRMVAAKIPFTDAAGFVDRAKRSRPGGLLKFDLHGNIRRPVEMAEILKAQKVPGLFLMMPRNPLNADFFDNRSTWDALHEIRDMGHEIGLHPDLFYLIRTYGDLYAGIAASVAEFKKRGFAIRSATVHGDTRAHIKARKLQANDFFAEKFRRSRWDGRPPAGEEFLAEHAYRYSYKRIFEEFGIRYFPELNFVADGELVRGGVEAYLTDNSRTFELRGTKNSKEKLRSPALFRLTPRFSREAIHTLKGKRFLALFHPQWYW